MGQRKGKLVIEHLLNVLYPQIWEWFEKWKHILSDSLEVPRGTKGSAPHGMMLCGTTGPVMLSVQGSSLLPRFWSFSDGDTKLPVFLDISAKLLSSLDQDYLLHLKTPRCLGHLQMSRQAEGGQRASRAGPSGSWKRVHLCYVLGETPKLQVAWMSLVPLRMSHQNIHFVSSCLGTIPSV